MSIMGSCVLGRRRVFFSPVSLSPTCVMLYPERGVRTDARQHVGRRLMPWAPVLPSILHALVVSWQMMFEWNAGTKYGITGISRVAEPWNPSAAPTLFPGLTPFKGGLSGVSRKDPGVPCGACALCVACPGWEHFAPHMMPATQAHACDVEVPTSASMRMAHGARTLR